MVLTQAIVRNVVRGPRQYNIAVYYAGGVVPTAEPPLTRMPELVLLDVCPFNDRGNLFGC